MSELKVTFPHMGNMYIALRALLERLGLEVIVPPPSSKRTLNLGVQHGPEFACLPLKINLGNFIEAAEKGANGIVMAGGVGPCRFGYYAQIQREILRDLGYPFKMFVLEPPDRSMAQFLAELRQLTRNNSWLDIIQAIRFGWKKAVAVDRLEKQLHQHRPREIRRGQSEKIYKQGLTRVDQAKTVRQIAEAEAATRAEFAALPIDKQKQCLQIGIVGEIYLQLDPFANCNLERLLGEMGVEVERSICLSEWVNEHLFKGLVHGIPDSKEAKAKARPYINHFLGGHGQDTVGSAIKFQEEGKDGIIQIAPLTCMPEIVAQSIFDKVREERQLPTMSLVVDEHAGEAGMITRLEAFVDLLGRRKLAGVKGVETVERISGY
ncbi:MAG TPA: CoA protein activase [Bacillota bacterium]|nr:CoA protein activase [Bacillota bacterium]